MDGRRERGIDESSARVPLTFPLPCWYTSSISCHRPRRIDCASCWGEDMPVGLRHCRGGTHAMPLAHVAPSAVRALAAAALAGLLAMPAPARATLVFEKDDFSLDVGIRLQPRVELERSLTPDWQRDFMIRRSRLKLGGKLQSATYKFEWRLDNTDRIGASAASQLAGVENAYMQYPLMG